MSLQPLDPQYADGIFTELATLEVHLDADPLVYGPKRLNGKIALARKMTARCERIFLDVSQRQTKLLLELEMKNLLANDPEVRAGRAVSERNAIATGKLKDEVQAVADAEHGVEELDAVLTVVKAKRSDLRDTQGRLRDQIRLCQEEIGLGGRWGSKSPRGTELEPGQGFADGADVQEVEDLIESVREVSDAETHLGAEVDDSDPEPEQEADLAAPADEPPARLDDIPPPPDPEEPVIIQGEDLVDEFGFVPHCAECGQKQHKVVGSGMCCPAGHGGCDSVPAEESKLDEAGEEPAAAAVLPGTVGDDDVSGFLDDEGEDESKPMSRREIEEADEELDIDSILANFEG